MNHPPISRARYLQENRKMRFEEAYDSWTQGRITQSEAALLLGQCERSFRPHIERYEADGLEGLLDKRLSQISKRRASSAEVEHVVHLYQSGFAGWNVAHFHSKYKQQHLGMNGLDASTHRWIPDEVWDLVVTMDDATGEHTSMFFCAQEGTLSSLHGLGQTIARYGLFASLYTDRGSHYFSTPVAGGKVDKQNQYPSGQSPASAGH